MISGDSLPGQGRRKKGRPCRFLSDASDPDRFLIIAAQHLSFLCLEFPEVFFFHIRPGVGRPVIDLNVVVYIGMAPYRIGQIFLSGQRIDISQRFLFSGIFPESQRSCRKIPHYRQKKRRLPVKSDQRPPLSWGSGRNPGIYPWILQIPGRDSGSYPWILQIPGKSSGSYRWIRPEPEKDFGVCRSVR